MPIAAIDHRLCEICPCFFRAASAPTFYAEGFCSRKRGRAVVQRIINSLRQRVLNASKMMLSILVSVLMVASIRALLVSGCGIAALVVGELNAPKIRLSVIRTLSRYSETRLRRLANVSTSFKMAVCFRVCYLSAHLRLRAWA